MTSTLTAATLPGGTGVAIRIGYPPRVSRTPKSSPPRAKSRRSRYTPPAPKKAGASKLWVPTTMFTCLALGIVVIAGNYLQILPGGEVSNNFLLIGLGLLILGFVLSTFLR
jgi:hypothetical protein